MRELIERIVKAARRPLLDIAERRLVKGTDGNWYSLGMPWGVKSTGEVSAPYYVQMGRDGTTRGKRFNSPAELRADQEKWQAGQDEEFRAELLKMTEDQLQSQAAYWLKSETEAA